MEKVVQIDSHLVQVLSWALTFLFVSLMSIIVWLAKTVISKVDNISTKQDSFTVNISSVKNQIENVTTNMAEIYDKLEDVPDLFKKSAVLEQMLIGIKDDLGSLKKEHTEFIKQLSELQTITAKNAEWIRMTELHNQK